MGVMRVALSIQPVDHFAQPWVEAGLNPVLELQTYISDASKRWSKHPPVVYSFQLAPASEEDGCDAMEVDVKDQEMLATIQKALPENMVEFFTLIFKMAKTIVELMQDPAKDDLNKELEMDTGKAEACYPVAMQALEEQEKAFSCGMQKAMEKQRSASSSCKFKIKQVQFCGLAGLFSGSLFLLPASWVPSFSQGWSRAYKQEGGTIYYTSDSSLTTKQAGWMYFFGISVAAFSALGLWRYYVAGREQKQAAKQKLLAEMFSKNKKSLAQCKVLWQGVLMAVRRVQAQLSEFKGIGAGRVDRQKDALRELLRALFGMLLAMEEFMIHVEACGYFPANFSVKSLLSKERYDAIHGAMFPAIQDATPIEALPVAHGCRCKV